MPDDAVAEALRYIRGRLADIRSVDDVVRAAGVGRRTLESRFHACMGRTILQEIHRMRLRQARQLLNSGDLSIEQIGAACGFGTTKQFREVFKRETGQSPGEYSARQRQSKPLQGGARSG